MSRPRLGRGLAALIPSDILDSSRRTSVPSRNNTGALRMVPLDQVRPNPEQPRVQFSAAELENLASSIAEHGVITPLLVRRGDNGGYILIAGERRLRASGLAGKDEVPVWIREEVGNQEQLLLALVENIQREDLDAIETANAYQRLIDDFRMTQDQVARRVGKDRTTVANSVRLLKLPDFAMSALRQSDISSGHAKALLSLGEPIKMRKALQKILDEGLSVRATERLVQTMLKPKRSKTKLSPVYRHATALLTSTLATKVAIEPRARGNRGRIVIDYYSAEDLTRLVDWLARTDHQGA
jgi:ParB family chromosome partitioning protein